MNTSSGDRSAAAVRILMGIQEAVTNGSDKHVDDVTVSVSLVDIVELLAGYLGDDDPVIEPAKTQPDVGSEEDWSEAGDHHPPTSIPKGAAVEPRLGSRFAGAGEGEV